MAVIIGETEYRTLQAQLMATLLAGMGSNNMYHVESAVGPSEAILNRCGISMAQPMHGGAAVEMPRCSVCHKTIYPGEKSVPNEFGGRAHESCKRAPTL